MSEVRVNNIVDYGGKGAPTFDNGAVISGVSSLGNQAKIGSNVTITSGGINVSGVTTAATLSGNLTGDVNSGFVTATSAVIGSGVTINAGGLNITGVVTATTFEGDGSSMTGVAMTITPLAYNPDVNDSLVTEATGIGITFDHRILAGSGNITIRETNGSGTVVENFGVGSSVTIAGRSVSFTPTSALTADKVYHINYPSGAFTNTSGDVSYVGTAYTFVVKPDNRSLWSWGYNTFGELGLNDKTKYSSPVQIPGTNWSGNVLAGSRFGMAVKTDGTLWSWGYGAIGILGQNSTISRSSPVQVPGTTWSTSIDTLASDNYYNSAAIKTDGTLWVWGKNNNGQLGLNQTDNTALSSPTQIPGTTWSKVTLGSYNMGAIKTDGTLWMWGQNTNGRLGLNQPQSGGRRSSPVQVGSDTTWSDVLAKNYHTMALKTDGTLWVWGYNYEGSLAQIPGNTKFSSPVQIPGTTWRSIGTNGGSSSHNTFATKTDGTMWAWGYGNHGVTGQNAPRTSGGEKSSPTQIGSDTTWGTIFSMGYARCGAIKTDNTLWTWGDNENSGQLGINDVNDRSSPTQVPGTTWNYISAGRRNFFATQQL